MVRATPSLMPGQPCTWPDPFSLQVHASDAVKSAMVDELGPHMPAGIVHAMLLLEQRLVVAAWQVWALTAQLPAAGDNLYLPDAFGEEQGLRTVISRRTWVPVGVNVLKLILHLDLDRELG